MQRLLLLDAIILNYKYGILYIFNLFRLVRKVLRLLREDTIETLLVLSFVMIFPIRKVLVILPDG